MLSALQWGFRNVFKQYVINDSVFYAVLLIAL